MKKKILISIMLALCAFAFVGCGNSKVKLQDYLIEQRENLFTASDDLYSVSFSTGQRECDYNFDGIINEKVPFGVLTLTKNNNQPLANDTYTYLVTINEQTYTGFLEKTNNNSYSSDLEVATLGNENINVQISFTGYTFKKDLTNTSSTFNVDSNAALNIANEHLNENLKNVLKDKNTKIEVVMKIMKDHSNEELKNYYWYIGVLATNGESMGILIDAHSGEIIAKKV